MKSTSFRSFSFGDTSLLHRVRLRCVVGSSPACRAFTVLAFTVLAFTVLGLMGLAVSAVAEADPFTSMRIDMVEKQVAARGIHEPSILDAMRRVPRHRFVPESAQARAYEDGPVPVAPGKALPQAYLSAQMIELLDLDGSEKVLEIGTGTGYDAALLSRLSRRVFTIEIDPDFGEQARRTLGELGYDNVEVRIGDGFRGWPEEAPFDAILITAAPSEMPKPLYAQLAPGGRMVVAVGDFVQDLQVITKTPDGPEVRRISPVRIGPMTGEGGRPRDRR